MALRVMARRIQIVRMEIGRESPSFAKRVFGRGFGSWEVICPEWLSGIWWWIRPWASMTAEIPLLAARTRGSPSSTARIRAAAKCWKGPGVFPNHVSLVTLRSHCGLWADLWGWFWRGVIRPEKMASKQMSGEKGGSPGAERIAGPFPGE